MLYHESRIYRIIGEQYEDDPVEHNQIPEQIYSGQNPDTPPAIPPG